MYGPGYEPPAIERIRKPHWTVENTRQTQAVVDRLRQDRDALIAVVGRNSAVVHTMHAAIVRFGVLDPNVRVE